MVGLSVMMADNFLTALNKASKWQIVAQLR